jgi:hypothetical protein
MATVDWKGFNTFILNADIIPNEKDIIIYIFASKLHNSTSLLDYNLRLLNGYVHFLDNKDTSKNIKKAWNAFIANMTTVAEVTNIAIKLLVLIHVNTASKNINMKDAYDISKKTYITNIDNSLLLTPKDKYEVITSIQDRVDKGFNGIESKILFKWNGFDTLFVNLTNADVRSYICNYFITELSDANAPAVNADSDAYILFKQLIIENDDETHITTLNTKIDNDSNPYTLINTLSKNLKYLFAYTDIDTSIETKTVDALKCFGDADTELITTFRAAPATKAIPAFDKNALPAGWQPYNMVNIVSYDIAELIDPNRAQKITNVTNFLTNVTAGTTPYDKFRPDIITLQNTSELMDDAPIYNALSNAIAANKYLVFEYEDGTPKKKDKLITLIKSDYFAKTRSIKYNNEPVVDYLDAAHTQYYLASVIIKYKIIVINVVDTTGAPIPFTRIFDAAITKIINANKKIKIDISNYDILITGNILDTDTSPELKKYEKSKCQYNAVDITNSYIISKGFKDKAVYPYDFSKTDVKFETNYASSRPIGKRMFQDPVKAPKKATTASSNKSGVKLKLTSLLEDIATELDKKSQKEINQILASVSAPNITIIPPKKATSVKAPGATSPKGAPAPVATPPKGSKISMHVITAINVKAAETDGMPAVTVFTGKCANAIYKPFKTGKASTDKKVDIIYDDKGAKVTGGVFKLDSEEKYCIHVQIPDGKGGDNAYYIHDIFIDNDNVYFHDTTGGKTDIDITKHVITSSSKKAPVTPPGTNIDIANLNFINFGDVTGFDYKTITKQPAGYSLITGIKPNISIKLTAGKSVKTVKANDTNIYWETGNKTNFCFKVNVSGADYYITNVKITHKITIKIGAKDENVNYLPK